MLTLLAAYMSLCMANILTKSNYRIAHIYGGWIYYKILHQHFVGNFTLYRLFNFLYQMFCYSNEDAIYIKPH